MGDHAVCLAYSLVCLFVRGPVSSSFTIMYLVSLPLLIYHRVINLMLGLGLLSKIIKATLLASLRVIASVVVFS